MAITVGGMASLVPSQGVLRVGDKVMAKTYDADAGLVPGDMGVVVEFLPNIAGGFLVPFCHFWSNFPRACACRDIYGPTEDVIKHEYVRMESPKVNIWCEI